MSLGAPHRESDVNEMSAPPNAPHTGKSEPQKRPTNLPLRDPKFFGREGELKEIHGLLTQHGTAGITQQASPHGDGGLGKTATAIAYGWQHQSDYPGGVFFVSASRSIWQAELMAVGKCLGLKRQSSQRATVAVVKKHLTAGAPSLLIFDGLNEPGLWSDMQQSELLPEGNCRCLVTTRRQQLEDLSMCTLDGLPRDQAVGMLATYRKDAGERDNRAVVREIVGWFDGLPFALSLVGAYMLIHSDMSWVSFRERLRSVGVGTVEEKRRGGLTVPDYASYLRALMDEFVEAMPRQYRIALEYAALMPAEKLMTKWLVALVEADKDSTAARLAGGGAAKPSATVVSDLIFVQLLRSLSVGHKTLRLHGALRKRILQRHSKNQFEIVDSLDNVDRLARRRGELAQATAQKSTGREELLPLLQLAGCLAEHGRAHDAVAVANHVAPLLHALGREQQVVELLSPLAEDDVLQQFEPGTAVVLLSNLAASLAKTGNAQSARRHMEHALQLDLRHLPEDDPALAVRHSNLAGILKALGEFVKARRHIETAIRIEEKHLGAEHQNLAIRHWWLGDIALSEGKKDEACSEYRISHRIMSKHHSPDNPQVQALAKILKRHDAAE